MTTLGKILVIGNSLESATGDISEEPAIAETMRELGYEVDFWEKRDAVEIMQNAPYKDYLFMFVADNRNLEIKHLDYLKEKFKTLLVYWISDYMDIGSWDRRYFIQDAMKVPDVLLVRQKTFWEEMKKEGANLHYWNFDSALNIFQKERDEEIYKGAIQGVYPILPIPVNFIGNWVHNPYRMKFLWEVQQFFPEELFITTKMPREFQEGQMDGFPSKYKFKNVRYALYGHAFNTLVSATKINLTMDWIVGEGFWSPRHTRMMCAGGFVMINYVPGMKEVYGESGDKVVYFDSVPDCVEKIRYYLIHNEEREEIAERGYQWANEFMRPKLRVKELIDYVKDLPRG